jgi:nucleotide-binding universal stress UspA family protein
VAPGKAELAERPLSTHLDLKLRKILIPVDFFDGSKKALDYAVAVAKSLNADLTLVHVVEPYPTTPGMSPVDSQTVLDSRRELEVT